MPDKKITVEDIPVEIHENELDSVPLMIYKKTGPGNIKKEVQNKKHPLVDINRCDTSELIRLPGIGPVLSARIIKYRQLLGGYVSKEQLREVYGLPAETYELIKNMISVDTLVVVRININTAGYRELDRLPYFEKSEINSVLKYRELEGKIDSIMELVDNKILSEEKAGKVRSYIRFD